MTGTSEWGVPPILSDRLELVSMSPGFIEALMGGDRERAASVIGLRLPASWPEEIHHLLNRRLEQMRRDPSEQPWLARAMVLRNDDRTVIGNIGFHGPPDGRGMVEVGYTVDPDHRRRGYAEEAVRALFDWASREHGIRLFRASVSPNNEPSLGLIRKLGFARTGVQWDEIDGEELVFELQRP